MNTSDWYAQLVKPSWAPPVAVFGIVWSVLYVIIAVTFGKVFLMAWAKEVPPQVVVPFVLNLIFNATFTPLQFGLRSNVLASIDIVLILGTIVWAMVAIWPYAPWIALMQLPYLVWVSIATALQLSITYLNR